MKSNEILNFFKENPVQYLSTIGLDGKPKVRPFQFMLEEKGKLYFCTCNKKRVFEEIKENPYVEFCIMGKNMNWLRTSGKVIFVKELSIKKKIIESNRLVKEIYKSYDNPIFEVFYLEETNFFMDYLTETMEQESKF